MADEYNKGLCEKVQKDFEEKFSVVFKKQEKLESRMNWFYILAIATLIAMVGNLLKEALI